MHPDISLEPREDTLILFTPGPAMGESFRVSKKHFLNQFPSWSTLTMCQRYFSTCRERLSSGKSRLKETVGRMNIWCLKMPQTAEPTNGNINNYVCKIVAHCQAGENTSQHNVIVCLDINWYQSNSNFKNTSATLYQPDSSTMALNGSKCLPKCTTWSHLKPESQKCVSVPPKAVPDSTWRAPKILECPSVFCCLQVKVLKTVPWDDTNPYKLLLKRTALIRSDGQHPPNHLIR